MGKSVYSTLLLIVAIISPAFTYSQPKSIEINPAECDRDFYRSIGDYYQAPQKEIYSFVQSLLPKEEIPVIYFIARTANISPSTVLKMRTGGMSYMDITKAYKLKPCIYNTCIDPSKCFLHPEIKDKCRPVKNSLKRLNDKKIIERVNLRFISEGHLCSPVYVSKLRKEGNDFLTINEKIIEEHKILREELKARFLNSENKQITEVTN